MLVLHENEVFSVSQTDEIPKSQEMSESSQKNFEYRLTSVISHFGKFSNSGHYVADVYK